MLDARTTTLNVPRQPPPKVSRCAPNDFESQTRFNWLGLITGTANR